MKWLKLALMLGGYFFWAYNASNGGLYREPDSGGGFATAQECEAVASAVEKVTGPIMVTSGTGEMSGTIAPGRPLGYKSLPSGDVTGNPASGGVSGPDWNASEPHYRAAPSPSSTPTPAAQQSSLIVLMPQCTFLQDSGS